MSLNASEVEAIFNASRDATEVLNGLLSDGGYIDGDNGTQIWIIIAGILVFFMHCGFAMLEAGSVEMKSSLNILFKNIGTITIGACMYYLTGWSFAYGRDNKDSGSAAFIGAGSGDFVVQDLADSDKALWFFQFAFAATAATIVSGAVAGRIQLGGYFIIAAWMTGFVYPVVSHWVWSSDGWLSAFIEDDSATTFFAADESCGLIDYAGSGVVHLTGGAAALVAAFVLGPRIGKFAEDGTPNELPPHNYGMMTLGTFILWFGWYGFNCGSTLAFDGPNAGKVALTTTLTPSAACLTCMFVQKFRKGKWDLPAALNGVLAGLVSITAGCSTVYDWATIPIGIIGGLVYIASAELLLMLKIDDPIGAIPVHGFAGIWGLLATGIFGSDIGLLDAYSCDLGFGGTQFGVQFVGALTITLWTCFATAILVVPLNLIGLLRVSEQAELDGLDISEHGAKTYTFAKLE